LARNAAAATALARGIAAPALDDATTTVADGTAVGLRIGTRERLAAARVDPAVIAATEPLPFVPAIRTEGQPF
jgi:hypothetical protein